MPYALNCDLNLIWNVALGVVFAQVVLVPFVRWLAAKVSLRLK